MTQLARYLSVAFGSLPGSASAWREDLALLLVAEQGQRDLAEMAGTLGPASALAGRLERGEQQADQNADDRHDNEQFHKREAESSRSLPR